MGLRAPLIFAVGFAVVSPTSGSCQDFQTNHPPAVIAWADGRWEYVDFVEDKSGTIIFAKRGGSPRAAMEHSVDKKTTTEVNAALRDFVAACGGTSVDLSRMFSLSGKSERLFQLIAGNRSGDCLQRLRQQYQDVQPGANPPPTARRLSDIAATSELQREDGNQITISNENMKLAPRVSKSHAPGTAYGSCLDSNLPHLVNANNEVYRLWNEESKEEGWASSLYVQADELQSAAESLKACAPDANYRGAHEQLTAAVDSYRVAAITMKTGISQEDMKLVAEGYDAMNDTLMPLASALVALDEIHHDAGQSAYASTDGSEFFSADVKVNIGVHCSDEWEDNFEMRDYCRQEQLEAVERLKARNPYSENVAPRDFEVIRLDCRRKWGHDYNMRDYCESHQVKAYRNLND